MRNAKALSMKLLEYSRKYNVNHQMILIRFFHERLLYRVSISDYREHLFLKGGNLLYSFQGYSARPTVDIDFLGSRISSEIEDIRRMFLQIITIDGNDAVIFRPETLVVTEINEQNEYMGIRVKVTAQLANIKHNIQIDIGFGDIIIPAPYTLLYPVLLEELASPIIRAYTLETVIAEKLQAIIVLAQLNGRMKDFYDIYTLLTTGQIDIEIVKDAIKKTFNNRGTPLNFDSVVFSEDFYRDTQRLRMWKAFLRKINVEDIPFENVVETIHQLVRELDDKE